MSRAEQRNVRGKTAQLKAADRLIQWLGQRDYYVPRPLPELPTAAIVSNRWRRDLSAQHLPLKRLREALRWLGSRRSALLTSRGTTCDRLVRRHCQQNQQPIVDVLFPSPRWSLDRWHTAIEHCHQSGSLSPLLSATARRWTAELAENGDSWWYPVFVSPVLTDVEVRSNPIEAYDNLPLADRALIGGADTLLALSARQKSTTGTLVARRLAEHSEISGRRGRTILAPEVDDTHHQWRSRLKRAGAESWPVSAHAEPSTRDAAQPVTSNPALLPSAMQLVVPGGARLAGAPLWGWCTPFPDEAFLIHWTRSCHGPWPDQNEGDYLDELLANDVEPRDPLHVLARILRQRRLIASSRAIRGAWPVVCFSELGLKELASRRVYRRHRVRWDAEPFALAVHKPWLIRRGCRPVSYGTEALYRKLPRSERPFYQRRASQSGAGTEIAWTAEKEWRHIGDLSLDDLPSSLGRIIVPDARSAACLLGLARWPLTVLPPGRP